MLKAIESLAARTPEKRRGESRNPLVAALGGFMRPRRDPTGTQQLQAYRGWAYKGVNVLAKRIAEIDFQLVEVRTMRDGSEERTPIAEHPLYELLGRGGRRRPNPHTTSYLFRKETQVDLSLTGNAYWIKVRDGSRVTDRGGIPRELWRARPDRMIPVIDTKTGLVLGWGFVGIGAGTTQTWPVEDVVHFRYENPSDPYFGLSPLMANAYAIDIDAFNHIYQQRFFEQGALSTIVIHSEDNIGEGDAKEVLDNFKKRHTGAKNSWLPIILGGGVTVTPISLSNRDLEAIELFKWSEEEILSIWGVSKTQLGLAGDVNLSNAHALDVAFNKNTVKPELTLQEHTIEKDLLPDYPERGEEAWLELDFENPVPGDREFELEEDLRLLNGGARTVNEIRSKRGDKPFGGPYGDMVQLPFSAVLVDPEAAELPSMGGEDEPPDPAEDEAEEEGEDRAIAPWLRADRAPSEEERTAFWHAWSRRAARWEPKLAAQVRSEFALELRNVLKALRAQAKRGLDAIHRDIDVERLIRESLGRDADARMQQLMRDTLTRLIKREGRQALALLADDTFDWKTTASRYLLTVENRIKGITRTTEKAVRAALVEGVQEEESIRKIAKRIQAVFQDASTHRAITIARTEVIGASNAAAEAGYAQGGAEKKGWLATRDDRVRDAHKAADGQVVPINSTFRVDGEELRYPGDPNGSAKNVIMCFLPGTLVTGSFVAGVRSEYAGPARELVTRSGLRLAVTPNHPILTAQGMRPAGAFRAGDELIADRSIVERRAGLADTAQVNDGERPVRIEDVFETLRIRGLSTMRDLTAEDLHGDAVFVQGQVHVVGADRLLRSDDQPTADEQLGQFPLVMESMSAPLHTNAGDSDLYVQRPFLPTRGVPRPPELSFDAHGIALDISPFEPLRIGPPANLDAVLQEATSENRADDPAFGRELLERHAALVTADEVVEIRDFEWTGHVYDLQSASGLMIAGGVITSNCRCTVEPR